MNQKKYLTQEKYLSELIDGNGHITKNKFKTEKKQPDYQGYIKIDNKNYKLSAWERDNGRGTFFTIKAIEADDFGNFML